MTLLLLENHLNLISMESEVTHRPFQGTPTFSSMFEVAVPDGFDMVTFGEELKQLGKNTNLMIRIREAISLMAPLTATTLSLTPRPFDAAPTHNINSSTGKILDGESGTSGHDFIIHGQSYRARNSK